MDDRSLLLLHRRVLLEFGAHLTVSGIVQRGHIIRTERGSLAREIVINKLHEILQLYFQNEFLLCST